MFYPRLLIMFLIQLADEVIILKESIMSDCEKLLLISWRVCGAVRCCPSSVTTQPSLLTLRGSGMGQGWAFYPNLRHCSEHKHRHFYFSDCQELRSHLS